MSSYIYMGDRFTDEGLRRKLCTAVRRQDGKCIRGKNGTMLVEFQGTKVVIIGRLLRKISNERKRELALVAHSCSKGAFESS